MQEEAARPAGDGDRGQGWVAGVETALRLLKKTMRRHWPHVGKVNTSLQRATTHYQRSSTRSPRPVRHCVTSQPALAPGLLIATHGNPYISDKHNLIPVGCSSHCFVTCYAVWQYYWALLTLVRAVT